MKRQSKANKIGPITFNVRKSLGHLPTCKYTYNTDRIYEAIVAKQLTLQTVTYSVLILGQNHTGVTKATTAEEQA